MSVMVSNTTASTKALDLPILYAVSRARAGRKLAFALGILLLTLPLVLLLVPWQQNVPGAGRVTAADPRQRIQTIPAPVTGRLVQLEVQEGSRVKKGDLLAIMEDQDPNFYRGLQQQVSYARQKVEAAHKTLEFYDEQLIQLTQGKGFSLESARYDLRAAIDKVRESESQLKAAEADEVQKSLNFQRQKSLNEGGVQSDKELQAAERAYKQALAKVKEAQAKVERARNEELSKMNKIDVIDNKLGAEIKKTASGREDAVGKLTLAQKDLNKAEIALRRQENQRIEAPMDGIILKIGGANRANFIGRGESLIEIVPDTDQLAVEMWMRGVDAPLIAQGRRARLQFEGWPAVQFAGWPSVAVGTFGGIVHLVDAQASADGRVRVLVTPDPDDAPWPDRRFLRQGVRASGWVQLDTVSAGYEIWRQLNAFPPSIRNGPGESNGTSKKPASKSMGDGGKGKE